MAIRDNTKQSFANALKSLLVTKEMNKIRIKELCDICGAERPTFYYHFRDKYDLITWIYEQDCRKALDRAGGHFNVSQLENLLTYMQEEQAFYKKAFSDNAQNALIPYIFQKNVRIARAVVRWKRGKDTLTEDQEFTVNFLSHAWLGCITDWISGKYDISAQRFAQMMYQNIKHLDISDIAETELK